MSDEQALLKAISAEPEEDTPRLAYADWLDEYAPADADRARAEFIRVQTELAWLPEFGDAATEERRDDLTTQEGELLSRYGQHWLQAVPFRTQAHAPHRVIFRRGFPEAGSFHVDYLRRCAADVFEHPLLRRVGVSPVTNNNLMSLLQSPWVAELGGLELLPADGNTPPNWGALAGANLRKLHSLALGFGGVLTPDTAERIAATATLSGVSTFSLKEDASSESVRLLFGGVAFRALTRLELTNFRGGTPSLPDVFANARLTGLQDVRFSGYLADVRGVERLTRSAAWATLRSLEISHGVLDRSAVQALAAARSGPLLSLTLTRNNFYDDAALCGPLLWGLRSLDVGGHDLVGPSLVNYLAECSQAVGLWHLGLGGNRAVGDATAARIAESPAFSQLRRLDLRNTALTRNGAKALAASPYLTDLGSLLVHGCNIGAYAQQLLYGRFGAGVRW